MAPDVKPGLAKGLTRIAIGVCLVSFALLSWWLIRFQYFIGHTLTALPFMVGTLSAALISLVLLLLFIFKARAKLLNFKLVAIVVFGAFLIAEFSFITLTYAGKLPTGQRLEDGSFGVFAEPCAVFDTIAGYRWLEMDCRIAKAVEGELVFDNTFIGNNMGYVSQSDYSYAKADSNTIRYAVFGDSYTTAIFAATNWVDRANEMLQSNNQNQELYSFAIDGGGIYNWHRIFFKETVPKYEFDAVILAIWVNDLDREYALMHHTDSMAYFRYFEEMPTDFEEFEQDYIPQMWHTAEVLGHAGVDERIKSAIEEGSNGQVKPRPYFLMWLHRTLETAAVVKNQEWFAERYLLGKEELTDDYSKEDFISSYSETKWQKLEEMLTWCAENEKQVILAILPDQQGVETNQYGTMNNIQREVTFIGEYFNFPVFDSYDLYPDMEKEVLDACFLRHDPHWSQQGSDVFAKAFTEYLMEEQE